MARFPSTLKRAGTTLGYGVLGIVCTAAVSFVLLNLAQPIQTVVYDMFYLQVGPSEATETAILVHFLLAGVVALGVAMLAGDYLSNRGANRRALGAGFGAMLALVFMFLVVALAGLAAFLTAFLVLAIWIVGIPIAMRYWFGVRSGAVPAFVGGIPVIVFLLVLAGFGLGWGWGYVVTAQEVPASTVNGTAAADFNDIPEVRNELFSGDCETTIENRQVCRMYLRGSEHEVAAAQFMARYGIRCPYQNIYSGEVDAFIAEHNGTYYRVTCSPHGD